jgi:CBS domain containing-hemolysin-like protein
MMTAIMHLDAVPVRKVMLPLNDMNLISVDSSFDEIVKTITTKSYSRYPVYKDTPDNIVGYLHIRDVWAHLHRKDAFHVKDCMREAHFVPETKSIFKQLVDFRPCASTGLRGGRVPAP